MKKLFFIYFLATSASIALAQSQIMYKPNAHFSATLPEFSYNGQAQIYSQNNMDKNGKLTFTFYSDEFEKQGELTISGVEYSWHNKSEERELNDNGYKGDWRVTSDNSGKTYGHIISLQYYDFDQSSDALAPIYLTQTLFNTDEKCEFLMPIYSSSDIVTYEADRDGDGDIDIRNYQTINRATGFQIVSEDGNVLQTVSFDGGFSADEQPWGNLLKIHGKLYLTILGKIDESDESTILLYSIDSTASGVRMMTMEKFSSVAPGSYDLSGRPTSGERGVNIIRMSDGTARKVLVQ